MNNLRVWHIPNPPREAFRFPVQNLEEAKRVFDLLWGYDNYLGDDLINANVSGLERLNPETNEWEEWYDHDTDEDFLEYLQRVDPLPTSQAQDAR